MRSREINERRFGNIPLSGASGQSETVLRPEHMWWRGPWTAPRQEGPQSPVLGLQMEAAQGPSTVVMTWVLHLHLVV